MLKDRNGKPINKGQQVDFNHGWETLKGEVIGTDDGAVQIQCHAPAKEYVIKPFDVMVTAEAEVPPANVPRAKKKATKKVVKKK